MTLPAGVATAADLRAHYSGVRKRLTGTKSPDPVLRIVPKVIPKVIPEVIPAVHTVSSSWDWRLSKCGQPFVISMEIMALVVESYQQNAVAQYQNIPIVGHIKVRNVVRVVAAHYGISEIDIISARRTKEVMRPRHVAYYLARTLTTLSLPEIGRRMGGKDHTSVLHGVAKMEKQIAGDEQLAAEVAELARVLVWRAA